MSRMFTGTDGQPMRTWNIFTGCDFRCDYCSARVLAETRLRKTDKYRMGFVPQFHLGELRRRFKPGEWVFVAYMGDISFANHLQVFSIFDIIAKFPETNFLFCTKKPQIYRDWDYAWNKSCPWPSNIYFGTTIESTWPYTGTRAPNPEDRYLAMSGPLLEDKKRFVSIEPVMDFDLDRMTAWMAEIKPAIIEVGADNYHNDLEEPPLAKLKALLRDLRKICPVVVEKEGLGRLLK